MLQPWLSRALSSSQLARRATDFIDGKRVIGGYRVSVPLAIIALVLYALLSAVAWYRKSRDTSNNWLVYGGARTNDAFL